VCATVDREKREKRREREERRRERERKVERSSWLSLAPARAMEGEKARAFLSVRVCAVLPRALSSKHVGEKRERTRARTQSLTHTLHLPMAVMADKRGPKLGDAASLCVGSCV